MKKHLAFLLALLIALSLVSCGAGEKETDGKFDPPPATDGSVNAGHDGETEDLDTDQTETEKAVQSVSYMGDWLIQDVLGDEYDAHDVVLVESNEEMQSCLDILKKNLATMVKDLAEMGERVTRTALEGALHLREAIDTFEEDAYLRNRKLLLIKIYSSYWQGKAEIRDIVLVEQDGECKLQVNVAMKYGFGSDVTAYMTLWVLVPDDLNIDYENDVEINVIKY